MSRKIRRIGSKKLTLTCEGRTVYEVEEGLNPTKVQVYEVTEGFLEY